MVRTRYLWNSIGCTLHPPWPLDASTGPRSVDTHTPSDHSHAQSPRQSQPRATIPEPKTTSPHVGRHRWCATRQSIPPPHRPVHLCVSADLSHQVTLAHCVPQVRQCCGAITSRTSRHARECHDCQRPVYKSHRHIETPGRTKHRPVGTRCQHTETVRVSSP